MRGNDFEENKVIPLIFKQFWSRSHLSKLDRLTPQDVYYMGTTIYLMSTSVLDVIVTIVEKFHGQNNYCFACRFFGWFFLGISFYDSLFFWLRGLLVRSSIRLERFCMKLICYCSCLFFTDERAPIKGARQIPLKKLEWMDPNLESTNHGFVFHIFYNKKQFYCHLFSLLWFSKKSALSIDLNK